MGFGIWEVQERERTRMWDLKQRNRGEWSWVGSWELRENIGCWGERWEVRGGERERDEVEVWDCELRGCDVLGVGINLIVAGLRTKMLALIAWELGLWN